MKKKSDHIRALEVVMSHINNEIFNGMAEMNHEDICFDHITPCVWLRYLENELLIRLYTNTTIEIILFPLLFYDKRFPLEGPVPHYVDTISLSDPDFIEHLVDKIRNLCESYRAHIATHKEWVAKG